MQLKPIEELSPRRQRRRMRNQEALTDAARRVFEQRGYIDVTVQDIIDEADIGRGTFYNYFDSKEALFSDLLHELIDEFVTAATELGEERSVRTRIELSMAKLARTARKNRAMLGAVQQAIHVNPEFAAIWKELRARLEHSIREDLDWCMAHGMLDRVNTEILAMMIAGMIETMLFEAATQRSYKLEDLEQVTVDVYWNAVFRPHEGADDYVIRPGETPLARVGTDERPARA